MEPSSMEPSTALGGAASRHDAALGTASTSGREVSPVT